MKPWKDALAGFAGIGLVCVVFNSGCAFGTRHADIAYPPPGVDEDTNAVTAISAPPGSRCPIALRPFTDDRADKRVVGHVRNGFGMKTAEVVGPDDLSTVVTEAVRDELTRAGYQVYQASTCTNPNTPVISGSLVEVYCDAYMSYEGTVDLFVWLSRDGKEFYQKTYMGKGSVGANWMSTGQSYGKSLSLALKDALESMKRDLPMALVQPPTH